MIREMIKLFKTTGGVKKFAFMLLLRCPFDAVSNVVYAVFFMRALEAVEVGGAAALFRACGWFFLASVCLFLYNGSVWMIYAPFAVRTEGGLRRALYEKMYSFSCERVESVPSGDWIARLNADVEMPFSQPLHLPHFVCSVVNVTASAIILYAINPAVFGWVTLFVVPHIAVSQIYIAQAMPELNRRSLEAKAKNADGLTAFITCADAASLYDASGFLTQKFLESSFGLLNANMKIHKRNAFGAAILPLFGLCGYLALLYASSGWIANERFTFGGLTGAFQFRGGVLLGSFMLINSVVSIKGSMAGITRLNAILAEGVA